MAAVLLLGAVLELGILTRRAYHAYQTARGHADSASTYPTFRDPNSWLNRSVFFGPGPLGVFPPSILRQFRALEQ
jgi:hypothetical protein